MFINNNTTAASASYGFVQPFLQNGISNTASLSLYFETPNLVCTNLSPSGNENCTQWVEGTVDIAKFLGVKDFEDDEDLVGSYSTSPATNVFLTVGVRAQDDTTVAPIRVAVQFVYECEFFSLNNAGMSLSRKLASKFADEKVKSGSPCCQTPAKQSETTTVLPKFVDASALSSARIAARLEKLEALAAYFESLRDPESN